MRTELTARPSTVWVYSAMCLTVAVVMPIIDPFLLLATVVFVPLGLSGLLFWRVSMDESGFTAERRGRVISFPFEKVAYVSEGAIGLPHLVLVLELGVGVDQIRFLPEPSHGRIWWGHHRLQQQLSDIIEASRDRAEGSADA